MQMVLDSLLGYLRENWPEILWIVAAAGIASYLAGYRARSRWRNRNFLNRLNVSLNFIDSGTLRIRTVLEMDCEDIFLSQPAAKAIWGYAKRTTKSNPILPIPEGDCWQYLNAVLNEISERFAEGQIRRELGQSVQRSVYLLCLTCERAGPVRTQKIRGMLVQKQLLEKLPEETPQFESPAHSTRWETLNQIAAEYQENANQFIEIEICV